MCACVHACVIGICSKLQRLYSLMGRSFWYLDYEFCFRDISVFMPAKNVTESLK